MVDRDGAPIASKRFRLELRGQGKRRFLSFETDADGRTQLSLAREWTGPAVEQAIASVYRRNDGRRADLLSKGPWPPGSHDLGDFVLGRRALGAGVITRTHPVTNEKVWYNQSNLWHVSNFEEQRRKTLLQICGEEGLPTHCYFGDGSPMTEAELEVVRKTMWDTSVAFPWEQGDILVLDNIMAAHGRNSFDGPRKVLVAMG